MTDRERALERAVVAFDLILFPQDDHTESERSVMRRQLVTALAEEMERRGWAGTTEENARHIEETAQTVVERCTDSQQTFAQVEKALRTMMAQGWLVPNIHTGEDGIIDRLRQQMGGE